MSSSIFTEKRTRSQLTLPDQLLFQLSQRSPLKDARTAARTNSSIQAGSSMGTRVESAEESDDELLLSPGKAVPQTRTTKRSVSPPLDDEYASRPDSPPNGRELKRLKLDGDGQPTTNGESNLKNSIVFAPRPTHTRTLSQPEPGKKASRNRSGTISSTPNPSKPDLDGSAPSGKGRAQSVPLFPSSSSSSILHIDLRNPPPSPRRPRSRSPSKEPEFRIVSGPSSVANVATIPEEADLAMNVDEDNVEPSKFQTCLQTGIFDSVGVPDTKAISDDTLAEMISPGLPEIAPSIQDLYIPTIYEPPSTPTTKRLIMTPLSPLTPLPETPHPPKFTASAENRYTGIGWGNNPQEADKDHVSTLTPAPSKPLSSLALTTRSRLPRPSSSLNLASSAAVPPPTQTILIAKPAMHMGPPLVVPSAKGALVSSTLEPRTIVPAKANNAFTVMMAKARENKEKGKGKGKEKTIPTKVGSSSKGAARAASESKLTQKGKTCDKDEERDAPPPKMSIKSQMKPRQKPKPKAAAVPVPQLSVDSGDRPPHSPSTQATSPINSPPPSRPSSPPIMDVSMKNVDPLAMVEVKPPHMSENLPSGSFVTRDPSDTGPLLQMVSEHPQAPEELLPSPTPATLVVDVPSEAAANNPLDHPIPKHIVMDPAVTVAIPTEASLTLPPLIELATRLTATGSGTERALPKPAKTKLHISKRVPKVVAPADRVTRSASSKRNQNAPEIPKPVSRKTSGKVLVRKKSITAVELSVPGPSSKATDHALWDEASTSSLSDPPTDLVEPVLPSGSPIKLGSPVKASKDASLARPTCPTAAKTGSSKSPEKTKPAKSATPSPSKLTRSASLFSSRATGTLSRTFTFAGYGNKAGSSLSTLSSALEKLHQPPPGRPNTSMGFNRDDLDSSFELKTRSKDDTSISASGSASPTKGAGSSSQAAVGGSRLVQPTLINGPRSSITGKSIFGTGTMMRGTGGFKVPRNSLKPGTRVFGTSGGAFADPSRVRSMQKASRKTSLPSVMASPVKGGDKGDVMDVGEDGDREADPGTSTTIPTDVPADQEAIVNDKGKGKERSTDAWRSNASRRVSLASQALSQSLNALPPNETLGLGLMGPPATPTRNTTRSASSTYPSATASMPSGDDASQRVSPSTRSMTMTLRNASSATKAGNSGSKISTATAAASYVPEALKVLKDCVIYVDVRTDDGDEAGSLFVEMLEGVGARILTRVGQTCTHIVFKNGLMSTLTRYRLLRDPKPLVVGIAWVVECVEQMKQVDETKFLIDLDCMNVSGTTKRRRSMLPKLISRAFNERGSSDVEGDVSMDGSASSMILDDDLTPLEKARRRKGITSSR